VGNVTVKRILKGSSKGERLQFATFAQLMANLTDCFESCNTLCYFYRPANVTCLRPDMDGTDRDLRSGKTSGWDHGDGRMHIAEIRETVCVIGNTDRKRETVHVIGNNERGSVRNW
jgi:hypothetical protein